MISLLNSKESKELDYITISNGVSREELIDNAGKTIAYHIIENIPNPFKKKVLCIAGLGDNGVDSIVCSSYLNKNRVHSDSLLIEPEKMDSKYLELYIHNKYLKFSENIDFNQYDIIVDGIFGTGLNRPIESIYLDVIKKIYCHENIISIDIPSGIYADSGASSNINLKAKHTITFGYFKIGHFLSEGYSAAGKRYVYDIGHSTYESKQGIYLINKTDISNLHKKRNIKSDKYSKGKTLSLTGSLNYTGASLLSSSACLKSGCGIIKNIYPRSLYEEIIKIKESIDVPLEDNNLGYLRSINFDEIKSLYDWPDVFLIGPGLSLAPDSIKLVEKILSTYNGKCIIDATGLSSINYKKDKFSGIPGQSILTPHYGEFARLIDVTKKDVENNTIKLIEEVSQYLEDRILILKGPNTIIANSKKEKYIIQDGSSLLSTAGTGDILAGIISSYVAAGYSLEDSSILGVYLHAKTSKAMEESELENIMASDMIDFIPRIQSRINQKNV